MFSLSTDVNRGSCQPGNTLLHSWTFILTVATAVSVPNPHHDMWSAALSAAGTVLSLVYLLLVHWQEPSLSYLCMCVT